MPCSRLYIGKIPIVNFTFFGKAFSLIGNVGVRIGFVFADWHGFKSQRGWYGLAGLARWAGLGHSGEEIAANPISIPFTPLSG